jgi:hypothetical protein
LWKVKFCQTCTNAFHKKCQAAAFSQGVQPGNCPECGSNAAQIKSISDRERREREQLLRQDRQVQVESMRGDAGSQAVFSSQPSIPAARNYPVSRLCPNCKQTKFKSVRPDRWVTFTWDRVCSDCGTRYSPPAPEWAVPVFFLAALLLAVIGCGSLVFSWFPALLTSKPSDLCGGFVGTAGGIFFLILAVAAILQGVRALRQKPDDQGEGLEGTTKAGRVDLGNVSPEAQTPDNQSKL